MRSRWAVPQHEAPVGADRGWQHRCDDRYTIDGVATTTTGPTSPVSDTSAACGGLGDYRGHRWSNEPGYQITVTNTSTSVINVSGFVVTFTSGGVQTGSDQEAVTPAYLRPGWFVRMDADPLERPMDQGARFSGVIDPGGICQVVSVLVSVFNGGA